MGSHTFRQPETQVALDAIRRIVHALRESSRWAENNLGLSGAQLFVLQTLAESPAVSVNELAALTHTHQSSVSAVLTRLVARGLVRRVRSGADRRRVELSLSSSGVRLAARAPDVPQERLIRGIEQLPIARRRQLAASLTELAQALDAADRAPAMFFEDDDARRAATRARRRPGQPVAERAAQRGGERGVRRGIQPTTGRRNA